MLIWTLNSLYEVDPIERRIRRVHGEDPPTMRIGTDWRTYRQIKVQVGLPAVILWAISPEGALQTTVTSNVVAVENQSDREQTH